MNPNPNSGAETFLMKLTSNSRRLCIGLASVLGVVFLWVASGFLTNEILSDFDKPFFVTYAGTVSFQLYFLFLFIYDRFLKPLKSKTKTDQLSMKESSEESKEEEKLPPLTALQTLKIGFFFFLIYFAANYTMNLAFGWTSVGSASILASTSGLFTMIFAFIFRQEQITTMKVLSILISVGGAIIISHQEFSGEGNNTKGNMMALTSAVCYGLYSVTLKKIAVNESRVNMPLLFGIIGFFCTLFLWPIFLIFHYTSFEEFLFPTGKILGYLILNILFGSLLANFLWLVAMSYSTPLIVAIGLSMNIPLTLLGEVVLQHKEIPLYKIMSALCVVVGFLIVNIAELIPSIDSKLDSIFCLFRKANKPLEKA